MPRPQVRPERADRPRQVSPDELAPTGREIPAIPVDPYRPKATSPVGGNRGTADEPLLTLDFEEDNLLDVIKIIGAQTGKNFDIDPQMAQMKVTLISHAPIPASMAYDILGSLLQMRGYDMVEVLDGHLVRIVQTGQFTEKSPLVIGRDDPKGYDRVATHIVPILYANAADLQSLLQQLGSQTAIVSVYENQHAHHHGQRGRHPQHVVIHSGGRRSGVRDGNGDLSRSNTRGQEVGDADPGHSGRDGGRRSAAAERRGRRRTGARNRPVRTCRAARNRRWSATRKRCASCRTSG